MKLKKIVEKYILFNQSMGIKYETGAYLLRRFCRTVGDADITEVKPDSVLAFINGEGPMTTSRYGRFYLLSKFYRFAIGRDYVSYSPLPRTMPKCPKTFTPHVYTIDEIRRLIAARKFIKRYSTLLQPTTFRMLLLTLYGTGLRIGEARSLKLANVDLSNSLITVRDTKFYKSRLVPIGPKLKKLLANYRRKRRRLPMPAGEDSAFFVTCKGNALHKGLLERVFWKLRKHVGLHTDGVRYQPRVHDLRGTFAVHTLIAWYRKGANVQHLVHALSTYLGHIDIKSTQRYLTMIPELQAEANRLFERYALGGEK